jgi:hypothetical protein
MGIADSILGNVKSQVGSLISGAMRRGTDEAGRQIGKAVEEKVKEAAVNIEAELKKLSFERAEDGSYRIFYEVKQIGMINKREVDIIKTKKRAEAINALYFHLSAMHPSLKNKELSKRFSEKLLDDIGIKE